MLVAARRAQEVQVAVSRSAADPVSLAWPGALLDLTLTAPCAKDGRIEIRHGGLAFAQRMPAGPLHLIFPALAGAGRVSILLPDGTLMAATRQVADMARHRRFGLSWQRFGDAGLAPPLRAAVLVAPGPAEIDLHPAGACATRLEAVTVLSEGGRAEITDLFVDLPECGARTPGLHLKNLDQGLKIALR
jgi:hypothetical protein